MSTKQKGIFYGYPECCIDNFIQVPSNADIKYSVLNIW